MKARLLKKLRKESKKLKLIRGEDYQYIVTDSPHDILRPKLDTYYSGTYYCGQELLFDEDVIVSLKVIEIMGKRSISDDDIVRIFNTVKAMNPGPFKITDVVRDLKKNGFPRPENFMAVLRKQGVIEPDGAIYTKGFMWKEHGPLYKTRVIELITISRKEMAKIQRDAYAKRMAIKAGTYVAPPKPKPQAEMEAVTEAEEDKHLIPITQAEMEAIKFLKSRGYRITKLITVEQIV